MEQLNKRRILIIILACLTLFSGFVRGGSLNENRHVEFLEQYGALGKNISYVSTEANNLIEDESYSENKDSWEDLKNKSTVLGEEIQKYSDDEEWKATYPLLNDYILSLSNVTTKGNQLAQKEKLDDTNEKDFNDLKSAIKSSNEKLEALENFIESDLKDELEENKISVSLNSLYNPDLPQPIVLAKEEKAEQARIAAEQKAAAEKAEQERIAAEQKAAAEKAEQERIAAEQRAAAEKAERERIAAEQERAAANNTDSSEQSGSNMAEGSFVLNTNTGKLHRATCKDVGKMNEANKSYIEGPIDLTNYNLCKHCF